MAAALEETKDVPGSTNQAEHNLLKKEDPMAPPESHQIRALFRKAVVLQLRQKATNIIQILTPIIGLSIIVIIKALAEWQIDKLAPQYNMQIPYFLNMPYHLVNDPALGLFTTSCLSWYLYNFPPEATLSTREYIGSNTGTPVNDPTSFGMLSAGTNIIQGRCYHEPSGLLRSVPYFNKTDNDSVTLDGYLLDVLDKLKGKSLKVFDYSQELEDLHLLPDGAITFHIANKTLLKYHIMSNDKYYIQYHRNNGVSKLGVVISNETMYIPRSIEGLISFADLINRAYIRSVFPKLFVVTGIQYLPMKLSQQARIDRAIHFMGTGIFPLCMSLLLPVFIYIIVLEKEQKIIEIMKMNGMKMRYYWLVNFLMDILLYAVTFVVYFIYGGLILGIDAFLLTSPLFQLIMFGLWGYAQVAVAFLVSPFLSRAQSATIVGYVMALWLTVIALTLNNTLYDYPNVMPFSLSLIPTFNFCRLYYRLSHACGFEVCFTSITMIDQEVGKLLITLLITSTFYLIIGLYLHEVIPQEYGVPRHPLFFVTAIKNWFKKKRGGNPDEGSSESHQAALANSGEERNEEEDGGKQDADCAKEEEAIKKMTLDEIKRCPLVVKGVKKVFPPTAKGLKPKIADNKVYFLIRPGETFGLLGPNGAGKTTLISILTGMYKATSGDAWVSGYHIGSEVSLIQLSIGVCPQFDILWSDLTVEEHLLFYARLKGIQPKDEDAMVKKAIEEVFLTKFCDFKTRELSGGMKRRLSVAISLVGNPRIVFLDEPSTGLDPENRRQLWDILSASKGKRAIVLTTHSMEEADVLCSRIGIINHGVLKCIGNQVHLKNKFGGGYQLFVNLYQKKQLRLMKDGKSGQSELSSEEIERALKCKVGELYAKAVEFIKKLIPSAKILRAFRGNFVFEIPLQSIDATNIFKEIEQNKKQYLISDWGFSQCTLEDVFTKLCHDL